MIQNIHGNIITDSGLFIEFPDQIVQDHPLANLVAESIRNGEGIQRFLPFPEEGLDLALCSIATASCICNLFRRNPDLWKIVPHVNEVPLDADIQSLFLHLKKTAGSSYADSLDELMNILLPLINLYYLLRTHTKSCLRLTWEQMLKSNRIKTFQYDNLYNTKNRIKFAVSSKARMLNFNFKSNEIDTRRRRTHCGNP